MIPLILSIGRCVIDWISGGTGCSAPVCVYNTNAYSRYFQSIACVTIHISHIKNSAKCLGHWCPVGQDVSLTSNDMCELANGIYRVLFLICVYTYERGWVTYF